MIKLGGEIMQAVPHIKDLIEQGKKVGIFSCEDPYNTPFHKDLLSLADYIHLIPKASGLVVPASLDLGLQAKGINAWGIFGHYGNVHGHEVCAAISALNTGYEHFGPDLRQDLDSLSHQYTYQTEKSLRENVVDWVKVQYDLLSKLIPEKQKTLQGAVQGDIVIFAGLVENSEDAKSYKAEILFSSQ